MYQSGHNIYQMKAKYLSYLVVPIILLFIKSMKIYAVNSKQILHFYLHFFNVDDSINIDHSLLKFSVVILIMIIQGSVSQISYLGPSSHVMSFRK